MRLPRLAAQASPMQRETVTGRGINYTENAADGDLAACENLSARRWPALATRNGRAQWEDYEGVSALFYWNGVVAVKGTEVWYRGVKVAGAVTAGAKQFAAVNTRLVIWPDAVYLDLSNPESPKLVDMAVELDADRLIFNRGTTETIQETGYTAVSTWSTVQVRIVQKPNENITLLDVLKIGDGIEISGITGDYAENNRAVLIKDLTADTITIQGNPFKTDTDEQGQPVATTVTGTFKLERKIPGMDFICESGNRLWGCSNATKTIYSSVLGDPTNFFVYDGLSTDGYALPVATEGDFTGCCRLSSSLLFWKEKTLHKLIGDYPAEYVMYTYELEGLRAGCHKSLQVINDVLFYVGLHGVFTYAGGSPGDLSGPFGDHEITGAVGGSDGENYWLSCLDNGVRALYVYWSGPGIWLRQDGAECLDFIRQGKDVSFLRADGTVWQADTGEPDQNADWSLTFAPFYERISNSRNGSRTVTEGRKRYSRLLIRAELPVGAWMEAKVTCDGGRSESVGRIVGRDEDVSQLWIRPNRCDKFEVTLTGHGPCVIRNILREFTVGGPG